MGDHNCGSLRRVSSQGSLGHKSISRLLHEPQTQAKPGRKVLSRSPSFFEESTPIAYASKSSNCGQIASTRVLLPIMAIEYVLGVHAHHAPEIFPDPKFPCEFADVRQDPTPSDVGEDTGIAQSESRSWSEIVFATTWLPDQAFRSRKFRDWHS